MNQEHALCLLWHLKWQPMILGSEEEPEVKNPQAPPPGLSRRGPRVMLGHGEVPSVLGKAMAALVKFWLGLNVTSSKFLDFRETI